MNKNKLLSIQIHPKGSNFTVKGMIFQSEKKIKFVKYRIYLLEWK